MDAASTENKKSPWRLFARIVVVVVLALLLLGSLAVGTDTLKYVSPELSKTLKKFAANIGILGLDGEAGAAGSDGDPGQPGPVGPIGPTGSKGDTGAQGEPGKPGSAGAKGATGATGPMGPTGTQGPAGEKGDTGSTGAQGDKGDKGDTGPKGDTGAQGQKGDAGATGAVGPMGETGAKGEKGDTGATGAQGEKGDTGSAGLPGAQGEKGDTGPMGPAGPPGDKGDTGAQGEPGTSIVGNHGSFFDTTTQSHSTTFTARPMQLNSTVASDTSGFSIMNNTSGKPTRIKAAHSGVYNIQFSAQLGRVGNKNNDMFTEIWLAYDGQPIDDSNTKFFITGNQPEVAKSVAAWNFLVTIPAGHYVELMWAVSDTDFVMPRLTQNSETPSLVGPDVPSLIVTVSQVG